MERLAQGFSVTPDVILRVLKSKFIPPPERKTKQDAKVMSGLGQHVLPSGATAGKERLKLPGSHTPELLPSGNKEGALIPANDRTLMVGGEASVSLVRSPTPVTALPTQFTAGVTRAATVTSSTEEGSHTCTHPPEEDREGEESWDGQVLTEEELEELMEIQKVVPPAVQVGKDFFDAEGKFLYRI